MRDERGVADLQVTLGAESRGVLCDAFAGARSSIEAQYYSIGDEAVVSELNAAARRGVAVTLHVEGDPGRYKHRISHIPYADHVRSTAAKYAGAFDPRVHLVVESDSKTLEHAKAAVVDGTRAFIATANPNTEGFRAPGQVMVEDDAPADVVAIRAAIAGDDAQSSRIVSGPDAQSRQRIAKILEAPCCERIAIEALSDPAIVSALIARHAHGINDELIVKCEDTPTQQMRDLAAAGVAIRTLPGAHLHDKYIDAVDRIYLGSANLTRNGLDEAREIGIVANATDFGNGVNSLRADFDAMWSKAVPIGA